MLKNIILNKILVENNHIADEIKT